MAPVNTPEAGFPQLPRAWPDHPVICTFLVRLPFPLGLPDGFAISIPVAASWRDPSSAGIFASNQCWVSVKLHNLPSAGMPLVSTDIANAAFEFFYQQRPLPGGMAPEWPNENAYEQWVSLETPSDALDGERTDTDPAYAFHRSLSVLNAFLLAHLVGFEHTVSRTVTTQDLAPMFFVGEFELDKTSWRFVTPMITHAENFPAFDPVRAKSHLLRAEPIGPTDVITSALLLAAAGHPLYIQAYLQSRITQARRRGDNVDAVVSLQMAAETRLWGVFRLLLIDFDLTSAELEQHLGYELPLDSLLRPKLQNLLGGRWDLTTDACAIGNYWASVYRVRNRVVHAGYQPTPVEVERANTAFAALREFLNCRLWTKRNHFPRATLATLGEDGIRKRGLDSIESERWLEALMAEPKPFFWPPDVAGRSIDPKKRRLAPAVPTARVRRGRV